MDKAPLPPGLYLVSTPIGNLEDLSERARRALAEADLVACEDTRRTGRLLQQVGLPKRPLLSVHEHNEDRRIPELLERLTAGESIALVSDAGTPLLSDPGFRAARAAIGAGQAVFAIPGPSALLAALVVSGLPPHPFTFAGFPPPKSGKRRTFFGRFRDLEHTTVFYLSPHRVARALQDLLATFGDRPACLARELTKRFEEVRRGSLADLAESVEQSPPRGELVLVVAGAEKEK